ncbi:MAG: glycosyltransferase family 9 protein [Verrucomicrobia bacterium]|nr:MAG: glycosyltransferase family 9 protein [Verrucomicrobiota bacterium]
MNDGSEPMPSRAQPRGQGRILVVRGGALGDFILTLPVLAALKRSFPDAHLEVLGYPKPASLALAAGLADAVRPLESRALAGFFAGQGALSPEWSAYFAGFHVVLSFLYDPDRLFRENVGRVSRAQYIAGPHRPNEGAASHATEQLMVPLQRFAIFDADPIPRLGMAGLPAAAGSGTRVAVHVGSGSETKNWPEPLWAELLATWVGSTDWRIVLVGGEAEVERVERLRRALPADRCEVHLNRPLPELARELAGCAFFVGHDSGISHLAAAAGTRGLVLWGPTNETVWRPLSDRFLTLRHAGGLPNLPVAVVDARVRECVGVA